VAVAPLAFTLRADRGAALIFFCGFIVMHVHLSSLGHSPSAHFKAMWTGYKDTEGE
jgi:thiosulfate reductase cytochrome b subunit